MKSTIKKFLFVCILIILPIDIIHGSVKSNDYVPDNKTAIKIAEAIWFPIYGKRIYKKKPFVATLVGDTVWFVRGTLNGKKGGGPHAEIRKSDCKIINVYYDK